MAANFKLGKHDPGVGLSPHRHPRVYARREEIEGVYLTIAPESGHSELLALLVGKIDGPFTVWYDLLAGTPAFAEGRYELVEPLDLEGVRRLLNDFSDFLEHDARHDLRIESAPVPRLFLRSNPQILGYLVYDQHDLITAYAGDDVFEGPLLNAGFSPGTAELPIPHSHHIWPEYDADLKRLMTTRRWKFVGTPPEGSPYMP